MSQDTTTNGANKLKGMDSSSNSEDEEESISKSRTGKAASYK